MIHAGRKLYLQRLKLTSEHCVRDCRRTGKPARAALRNIHSAGLNRFRTGRGADPWSARVPPDQLLIGRSPHKL
jgi:hypothetical protein